MPDTAMIPSCPPPLRVSFRRRHGILPSPAMKLLEQLRTLTAVPH
ncbi:hypothetical protein [Paraburkholderia sp. CNPSo 3272]|nr:hypothetical protein [Paraburkholderia sp. CNPSo 3272]